MSDSGYRRMEARSFLLIWYIASFAYAGIFAKALVGG